MTSFRFALAALLLLIAACGGTPPPGGSPTGSPEPSPLETPASPSASPTPSAAVTPSASPSGSAVYAGTDWSATAFSLSNQVGQQFLFHCPPGGSAGVVWGTDTYTSDSSVCTAAVHAGLVSFGQGGDVTVEIRAGADVYAGTERNGVSSLAYPAYDASYVFVGEGTTPPPSSSPSESPGAGLTEIFSDSFTTTPSGWGIGSLGHGELGYGIDALELRMHSTGYLWSRREFGDGPFSGARVEGDISVDADGVGGLMCGAPDDEFYGMVIDTKGRWFAIRISGIADGGDVTILDQGTVEPSALVVGEEVHVVVGCSVIDGELTLTLAVGDPPAHVAVFVGESTVAGFDRAGVYGEALETPYVQTFDNVIAAAGDTGKDALVEQLLTHVPVAYRDRCEETTPSMAEPAALAAVACGLGAGPGAEIVEYVQFADANSMHEAFLGRLETWGAESTGSTCEEGPAQGTYSIGGQEVGSLFCAAQTAGIRLDWTDQRLAILASATDFDSSYPDLHQTWQEAGPEP